MKRSILAANFFAVVAIVAGTDWAAAQQRGQSGDPFASFAGP
jgi:hypothetical protein